MKHVAFERAAAIGMMEGEFVDRPHAAAVLIRRSPTLVITFSNLGCFKFKSEDRLPWLHNKVEASNASFLGLMTKEKDWYRNPDGAGILSDLNDLGYYDDFERIVMIGGSMGGFAALTHCDLVPDVEVLAFGPQSTLAPELVPFEGRFTRKQNAFDWTDPVRLDAAEISMKARHVRVMYDPQVEEDRLHVDRLSPANLERIHCRGLGHQLPNALKRAGLLDEVIAKTIDGTFDTLEFYRAFRLGRRKMLGNLRNMVEACLASGHTARAEAICRVARENGGGPFFRRTLHAIADQKAA